MGIERMESIVLLVPTSDRDRFVEWLYEQREVHLEEFREQPEEWTERFATLNGDPSPAELQVSRLQGTVDFLNEVHKKPSDFLEGLFPVRMLSTKQEIEDAVKSVDPERLSTETQKLQRDLESARELSERLAADRDRLQELSFLTVRLGDLRRLRYLTLRLAAATGQGQKAFVNDDRLGDAILVESVATRNETAIYVITAPKEADERIQEIIADYGLREVVLPPAEGTIAEEVKAVERELDQAKAREREVREKAVAAAKEWRNKAELALAWWESERTRILQQAYMVNSPHVFAATGYIRASRLESFRSRLTGEFPEAELDMLEQAPGVEPPVSMRWNNFFRPTGLLVNMFGLPSYRGIDPTSFLSMTFLIFFGICFGDLLYGIMLVSLAAWLKKRFRGQHGLVQFFRLFTYAGVSTMIFGVLMGSWGADLTMYFGEGNAADVLRQRLMLLDPLAKPVVALGIATTIGVTNQFYGIFMRFLRDFRRGDVASSFYDGIFWLSYLGSLIVLAIGLAVGAPKPVLYVSGGIFALSAIGLILTQGREEKSWPARIMTGVISLYGIMGTYGTTSFVGDVISYSRLMALGLTTSVVGMSFNMIAGMVKGVPYIGWLFFFIVVIFGHIFNFTMSIMSAFVHSARLILLEWFGRFYEGGGIPFRPYGFQSTHLDLIERESA
ncbi:MAG: V-type ATP synthase subunit I [Candidatus Latescibacterota bacterium]